MNRRDWLKGMLLFSVGCAVAGCTPPAPSAIATLPPTPVPTSPAAARTAPTLLSSPVAVSVADGQSSTTTSMYIGLERGYFRDAALDLNLVSVRTAPEQLPQLVSGQLHFGLAGPDPGTFNAIARGISIKAVLPLQVIAPGQKGLAGLVVRKDLLASGRYTRPGDLKGLTVALTSLGGSNQFWVDTILDRAGLTAADVTYQALPDPANIVTALSNKRVDAAWLTEPSITTGLASGIHERVIAAGEVFTGTTTLQVLSPAFEQQQPAAAQRFVTALLRSERDFYQAFQGTGGGQDSVFEILARHTTVTDPHVYANIAANSGLGGVDPDGVIDERLMVAQQEYFLRTAAQSQRLDIGAMIDRSYAANAVQQLGRVTA